MLPIDVLRDVYGYGEFRGQQLAIITAACDGRDCLVLMPTGGGKSICYQIPALLCPGLGIVVSPLIALMMDQVGALRQLGIRAAFLNSSQSPREQQLVLEEIESGELDLLYVAPERILQEQTLDFLSARSCSIIAIDEAHCVSAWGHDFRTDYLALAQLRERFPDTPRMALTATADERTRTDIIHRLALHEPLRFVAGFDRPNIRYSVQPKGETKSQLLEFLTPRRGDSGIVYCLSRKSVDGTAQWLAERGFTALPYHAGMPNPSRSAHQERFLREDGVIIVATIAFGMGIDKPDVRFVAHLDLPKSVEAYYQETGRAGRDGEPAEAWMVYGLQDVVRLTQMMNQSQAPEQHKRIEQEKLNALLGWCEVTRCRRAALLGYFGEEYPGTCGNCDVCLTPPITWDGTESAQKLLSCVYRTGQRFGAGHVIDVLRGAKTDRIQRLRHESLSTYAIGSDHSALWWRSVARQLIVQGFLFVDHERYGGLRLTASSRALLRGDLTLLLREDVDKPRLRRKPQAKTGITASDTALWEVLREQRTQLADEQGVPPYMIFHDATLMEMVRLRPSSREELLSVSGVGQNKLERYGDLFIDLVTSAAETAQYTRIVLDRNTQGESDELSDH
ncbi:MAG: DNA helicase RecQ [Gammaproteobacteria bacterium]|nr:DNA helicase RecQ [Gammaproteobacteria bacterium]